MRTHEDLIRFLVRYPSELTFGDEGPADVVDRWYAPGFVLRNDGLAIDRQRLLDHVRPARKNVVELHVDVHEALIVNDRIAAHYTLHAGMRTGATISTEILLIGRLAPDGRVAAIEQFTRVPAGDNAQTPR